MPGPAWPPLRWSPWPWTWPAGRPGLAAAIDDLIAHLHAVGQTTIHQPGIGNTLRYVLAEGLPEDWRRQRHVGRRAAHAAETMAAASAAIARAGADFWLTVTRTWSMTSPTARRRPW